MRRLVLVLALAAATSARTQSAEQLVQRPYPSPRAWHEATNQDFGGRGWLLEGVYLCGGASTDSGCGGGK